jgi:hypothetical protein
LYFETSPKTPFCFNAVRGSIRARCISAAPAALNRYPRGFTGAKKIDSWRMVAEQLRRQKNENKQRSICNSGSAREKRRATD